MGQWENLDDVFPYVVISPSKDMSEYQEKWLWLVHAHNLRAHEDFAVLGTNQPYYEDHWWFADAHMAIMFGLRWGTKNVDNGN